MVNIENRYDIVVVGGGPAGLASAKGAADTGARVALFEEHPGIGTPVQCGELFTRSALKEVGMKISKRWFANDFHNVRLVSPGKKEALIRLPKDANPPLFVMERKIWEKDLARIAAKVGARLFSRSCVTDLVFKDGKVEGVNVKHMGKEYRVRAKVVLACDGPGSPIGRRAGLRSYNSPEKFASIAQFQMAGIDIDPDVGEVHFHPTPSDIFYILPKGNGYANIGYGTLGDSGKVALTRLREFVKRDDRLTGGSVIEVNAGVEPMAGLLDEIATDRLLLVGDAAGMVNPITAAGMRFGIWAGIRSGRLAGEAAMAGETDAKRLGKVRRSFLKTFGRRFKFMLALRKMLFDLDPKDLDDMFSHIGTRDIPEKAFRGKREPIYYPLKMIVGMLAKKPKFIKKMKPLLPMIVGR